MRKEFGQYLRTLREERRISARQFAQQVGMDASNFSKIERGEAVPPSEETVARFAEALGIDIVDDRWGRLSALAQTCRYEIPEDVLEVDNAVELMPALFAHIRKEGTKSLEELFEKYKDVALGRE